ncbi:helix-turn-helix domain-containing protein [Kutzneria albida]|uniref:Putative DNA-binding protein n=1 Tax=Kutzneria albida DSM 43870 TaxID=1449976 RepID=W5W1U1_9PSEU|nr:helix-turn-helix transcriptional regulator [Kutzneria albida]AHH94521.1 putative DNA-binding protein [Kutzneria albida DSM 43870]
MDVNPADSVGRRVAKLRKLRGLTQRQLAERAHFSHQTVQAVEQGKQPPSPAFTAAAARALGLGVLDLTGQPYDSLISRHGTEQAHVPALEQAITEGRHAGVEGELMSLEELAACMEAVNVHRRNSRYADVAKELPTLLRQLHVLARELPLGNASERAHGLLANAYAQAMSTLHRLGHLSLAGWAGERCMWASERCGDPLRVAVADFHQALALLNSGGYSVGQRLLDAAAHDIRDLPSTSETLAVRGSLHLRSAIIAARSSNPVDAEAHLTEAREMARHVTDGHYYETSFSAANVEIHSVAVPVELCDGTTAVRRGAELQLPVEVNSSRRGHHYIDLARGWLLHGNREKALKTLNRARRITPQLTRYHPTVRETVMALVSTDKRSTESLSNFATWCGIRT